MSVNIYVWSTYLLFIAIVIESFFSQNWFDSIAGIIETYEAWAFIPLFVLFLGFAFQILCLFLCNVLYAGFLIYNSVIY